MKLRGTMSIDGSGSLKIGGVDLAKLASKHQTPLYVIDQQCIEDNIKQFKESFSSEMVETEIVYASKAFINGYICKLIAHHGLGIDVISEGDIRLLVRDQFPMERVYLHGNAKSTEELELALDFGIGRIVIDNIDELRKLQQLCHERHEIANIMLRVNPAVDTHTHRYLRTALDSSKFGISMFQSDIIELIRELKDDPYLRMKGIHCHIGSQINEEAAFLRACEELLSFSVRIRDELKFDIEELNFGGGFAIYYTKRDTPPSIETLLPAIVKRTEEYIAEHQLGLKKIIIEPGRSVVGPAGTTLYKIEAHKTTHSGRKYVMVNGGMSDNPRPALYNALYEAVIVDKVQTEATERVAVAGKCCESGDIIIEDIMLPKTQNGDIIAVAATGAYNYSMASNYNGLPLPGVVVVKNGIDRLVTRRQLPAELHSCDQSIEIIN